MSVNDIDINAVNRKAAAQALGSLGGKAKSEAKAAAARRNLEKANAARKVKASGLSTVTKAQESSSNVQS